jgi:hypothetical protein
MSVTRAHALALALPLALGLATLTGCGGSDGGNEVASVDGGEAADPSAEAEDPVAQGELFADCLRENGLEVPDPDPETGAIAFEDVVAEEGREAVMEGFEACRDLAPEQYSDQEEPTEEQLAAMQSFAECMRAEGVDVPDPGPEGFGPDALDLNDPATEDAMEVCQDELGSMGRGSQ